MTDDEARRALMRVAQRVRIVTFHRAMRCVDCRKKHAAGTATHAFSSPDGAVMLLICNGCHTAQWTWTIC